MRVGELAVLQKVVGGRSVLVSGSGLLLVPRQKPGQPQRSHQAHHLRGGVDANESLHYVSLRSTA